MVLSPSVIQDLVVHHTTACACLSVVLLAACAHMREEALTTVTAEAAPPTSFVAPPSEAAPRGRPRLSQTITLGRGTEQPFTPTAPRPEVQQAPSVVVNNNVAVQGAPAYYGYGRYYGHGAYDRSATFHSSDGRTGGQRDVPQWGSNGWEGARRSAAPGQTPGIGGNWAPAPSYGPAPMK